MREHIQRMPLDRLRGHIRRHLFRLMRLRILQSPRNMPEPISARLAAQLQWYFLRRRHRRRRSRGPSGKRSHRTRPHRRRLWRLWLRSSLSGLRSHHLPLQSGILRQTLCYRGRRRRLAGNMRLRGNQRPLSLLPLPLSLPLTLTLTLTWNLTTRPRNWHWHWYLHRAWTWWPLSRLRKPPIRELDIPLLELIRRQTTLPNGLLHRLKR